MITSLNFNYEISEPIERNNITVFFINSKNKIKSNILSFNEGLNNNLICVSEINKSGAVNYIKVDNPSNFKILILDSEQIIGNTLKQDRIVDATTLISEKSVTHLKVSCCERNRWSRFTSNEIYLSKSLFFSKGRMNNSNEIFSNYKTDQYKIWDDISEKLNEFKIRSFTESSEKLYKQNQSHIEDLISQFKVNSGDVGCAIAINGKIISLDIFFDEGLFKEYFPKLLRSVVLESICKNTQGHYISINSVYKLIKLFENSEKKMHKTTIGGLGKEIRFNNDYVVGSSLEYNNDIIHFSGFVKEIPKIPNFNESKVA